MAGFLWIAIALGPVWDLIGEQTSGSTAVGAVLMDSVISEIHLDNLLTPNGIEWGGESHARMLEIRVDRPHVEKARAILEVDAKQRPYLYIGAGRLRPGGPLSANRYWERRDYSKSLSHMQRVLSQGHPIASAALTAALKHSAFAREDIRVETMNLQRWTFFIKPGVLALGYFFHVRLSANGRLELFPVEVWDGGRATSVYGKSFSASI